MKPRRDITLGEMQDECKKHKNYPCDGCPYQSWCGACSPDGWDLTDTPRFTEAQMAFLRGLFAVGICRLEIGTREQWQVYAYNEVGTVLHFNSVLIGMTEDEYKTLDLAELFGKEGTK